MNDWNFLIWGAITEWMWLRLVLLECEASHRSTGGYSTIHGSETPRLPRLWDFQDSRDSKTYESLEAPRLPTPSGNMMSHTGKKLSTVWICCWCFCHHRSKGCSKAVWLHISVRDAFCVISYSRREEISMCTPLDLCWQYPWGTNYSSWFLTSY